jgi:predicted site-specific integrase-resolvase
MNTYTIRQFAERVGLSVKTLQRWDREGKLIPLRTPSNRRQYTDEHLRQALGLRGIQTTIETRKTVVYMRVSRQAQKPDLDNQRHALEQFCAARGLTVDEWIAEIGGGLNFKRPKFLKLIDAIVAGEVSTLIIAHKDRLARFGNDLLTHLCAAHQCEILVLNQETLSPEQEMVQDLMTIIHCFSSRLYGLRNYRKSLKEALASDGTSTQNTTEPDS